MKFHKAILIGQTETSQSLVSPGVITASSVLVGDMRITTESVDYYDSASGEFINIISPRESESYILTSSITDFPTEVSRSAAEFGFGQGGGGNLNNAVITASANLNTITFVKGNLSTFNVEVFPSGSIQSASRSETASIAEKLENSISSGQGINNFLFNGTGNQVVTLNTSSNHFLQPINAVTASSIINATAINNEITFTKGDGNSFNIIIDTGSGGGSGFPFTGDAIISGTLGVQSTSGFPDDLLLIKGPVDEGEVKVNNQGVLSLAWNGSIPPTAVEGGLYYTQSMFFVGI
jgi:hypothetical protein